MIKYSKEGGIIKPKGIKKLDGTADKKLNYFTFYYAGDNLDSVEWEERSLNQLVSFEKKKRYHT